MAEVDAAPSDGSTNPGLPPGSQPQQQRPTALRDALRAAASLRRTGTFSSEASLAPSESPSEEDYDELTALPAEAMVLRQRRKTHTQLQNEVLPESDGDGDEHPRTTGRARDAGVVPQFLPAPKPAVHTTGIDSSSESSPASLKQRGGGRNLSATVIFEEKRADSSSSLALSTAPTAVSSSASVDGEHGHLGIVKEDEAGPKSQQNSYVVSIDDPKLAEILRADLEQMREEMERQQKGPEKEDAAAARDGQSSSQQHSGTTAAHRPHAKGKSRGKFSDLVFTRGFSTFDRQNAAAANSPFHGFFTLFWMSVFVFMVKIAAENWRKTGSPLGTNEIMARMLHADVIVLLVSDGVLCALTGVSWIIQQIVFDGRLMEWDGAGWIVQNMWQALFVAGFVGWTHISSWPWSHTVFFVLHGLVMLMKQHSYAFYNGYLSSLYKRRATLQARLEELHMVELTNKKSDAVLDATENASTSAASRPDNSASNTANIEVLDRVVAALQSGQPLDANHALVFERILQWEIDGLTEELRGKATRPEKAYPNNLTFANHYEYIVLPTLVYELEYPRSESINWRYAAEKLVAIFGIIFVMIMISQAFMYPVVMRTLAMKEAGVPLGERFKEFPWMLSDLIFPFMMEYLVCPPSHKLKR